MQAPGTALVLGATGGIGSELMKALLKKGWQVRALTRGTPPDQKGVRWIKGDALDKAAVLQAAEGVQLIVHAVNPPKYQNWASLVLPMIDNTIHAAIQVGARIVLPGTLYNFGSGSSQPIQETSRQNPDTRKGRIRVELEERLKRASEQGARVLIVRAGDFFGPHTGGSWFSQGYVKAGQTVRSIQNPAAPGIGHAWAYLPDLAETIVRILDHESSLEKFETFIFKGHWDADGSEMAKAIQSQLPATRVKIRKFPWAIVSLAAPFSSLFKEMLEVKYLWKEEFRMDNSRLLRLLGEEPHTPLHEAVRQSLTGLGCK